MDKFIAYMRDDFAPKMNKLVDNPWIASLQAAMLTGLPLVLVGSLVTMFNLLGNVIPNFPSLSPLSQYSFGLFALVVAFLLPYNVLDKKGYHSKKVIAGLTSIAFYLMLTKPISEDGKLVFEASRLGAQGMFVAILGGFFVAAIMNFASKRSFFDEDSVVPDFVKGWFDTLIPITLVLITGWIVTFIFNIDIFNLITELFKPLGRMVNTFPGFVFIVFLTVFIYSFGISGWVLFGGVFPIYQANLAENMQAVAAGGQATNIAVQETLYSLIYIGGTGTTLALALMMLFLSKSQRLKAISKASIMPSIFNINEPLIFGAPIIFNPLLMIPFWICGIVVPSLAYLFMHFGLVNIPSQPYLLWYLPYPIGSYIATQDWRAIVAAIFIFLVTFVIYYPFFKAYDQQLLKEEKVNIEKES